MVAETEPMATEHVVREGDREWTETEHGEHGFRRAQLGAQAGGEQLGCSLYELPPDKRSWPLHYHTGNEEGIYVLSGEGTLRTGDGETALEPGDYVACPIGEAGAHQVVNAGDEPFRYLCVSTMNEPDVSVYPEMEKFGLFAGSAPGGPKEERTVSTYVKNEPVDYWD